jgi:hypothetical protein
MEKIIRKGYKSKNNICKNILEKNSAFPELVLWKALSERK